MLRTGTQIMVQSLLDHGVDLVFGYPGGTILPFYDELSHYADRITHVLPSHEQGAAHAADGYARATGRVGVCIATSGPGSTNLVTGIATAYMDSIPLVVITGNVPSSLLGTDSFQEVDTTGITMPITKHNILVKDVTKLRESMDLAFFLAKEGRPGPVLVDVPKDVQTASTEYEPRPEEADDASAPDHSHAVRLYQEENAQSLRQAADMIDGARRPMILIGGGILRSGASAQLLRFAELIKAPVSSSLMGLGAFPASHPLYIGNVGMHGNVVANTLSAECDLFVAIGTRFNDRIFGSLKDFLPSARVLHIDIDRAEISKNVLAHYKLVGDAGVVMDALADLVRDTDRSDWLAEIADLKRQNSNGVSEPQGDRLYPPAMMKLLRKIIGNDATVVTDVGQHQMWVALHLPFEKPCTLITSGGMGTMGFGLGAAIGAQMGKPDTTTVLVTGDGCFRMNCNELATVAFYGLPIVIVLMNNGTLGMVRQWQTLFYEKRYFATTLNRGPDFVKLAEAYGLEGHRVETLSQFEKYLSDAVAARKPVVLDCRIEIDEKVRPMVGPGQPITNFVLK